MNLSYAGIKNVTASEDRSQFDYDVLFTQHWDRLCQAVFRLVDDWDEAQDIALETFLKLHLQPPKDDRNITGWLYRVATNKGLNSLRAKKRRVDYERQTGPNEVEKHWADDPVDIVESALERQHVRQALKSLKPRSAQLLVLRYTGLSYRELAGVLNVSKSSIGTLLARAEKQFVQSYTSIVDPKIEEA